MKTGHGSVPVCVYGDPEKPALVTGPDLALNCKCNSFSSGLNFSVYMLCKKFFSLEQKGVLVL